MTSSATQRGGETNAVRLPLAGGRFLHLGDRPLVMGIVNITPDSFSDGGAWLEASAAIEHGLRLAEEGAQLLDLGAESTRPGGGVYGSGARDVSVQEELDRLLPVLEGLRRESSLPLSIDTRKGEVARQALAAGGDLINDVSALGDPALGEAVARAGCALILMHSRGDLRTMQVEPHYDDLLGEVTAELSAAVDRARAAGIPTDRLVIDPGIGFGKSYDHNLGLLGGLEALAQLGPPILVGASRKSFIGHLTGGAGPDDRLAGSLAAVAWAARLNAAMVRVHDVRETVRFLEVWSAIGRHAPEGTA